MTKTAIRRLSCSVCVIVAATMSGLCVPASAQKGLRVGVSVRVPIHPMSDVDKSNINSILAGFLCLVGLAVALVCLYFFYQVVKGFWDWTKNELRSRQWQEWELDGFLPPQNVRSNDPEQVKIEVALAKLRKQEWEQRTAVCRDHAEKEAQSFAEKERAA